MSDVVSKDTANALIKKCREACDAIFKEAGFELVKSRGSFGDRLEIRFSAIPSAVNELGLNPNSAEVIDFHRYHKLYNIEEKALGQLFTVDKSTYKLMGIAASRSKFPLVVENATGEKKLLTTHPRVIEAINKAALCVAPAPEVASSSSTPRKPRSKTR